MIKKIQNFIEIALIIITAPIWIMCLVAMLSEIYYEVGTDEEVFGRVLRTLLSKEVL